MPRLASGIDVGTRGARLIEGRWKGGTFHASAFAWAENPAARPAGGYRALAVRKKPAPARVGLTGRDLNIRYTRVPRVPEWQLEKLMRFEAMDVGEQSGAGIASDFNLLPELPEIEGEDVVLLAMAREELLEEHLEGLSALGARLDAFSPNALALYNAFLRYGVVQDENVLLANVGHENLDVALCRGPDLLFARNLSGGSRMFDQAIAERFGVSEARAEDVKRRMVDLTPGARHADSNAEKASRAVQAAAGQLLSLLQSAVLFSKSQLKIPGLSIDRVLLCGGGAKLRGLAEYLRQGMGVPVERFDPFRVVEVGGLPPEEAELLAEHADEAVIALGLATMASDPEAYSVEILPAAVRRRREFWGRTAFLVAAGLLAVLYLGWEAWSQSRALEATRAESARLSRELRRAKSRHEETAALLEENARLEELVTELWVTAGTGEQVARVLDALERVLPREFWLTRLSSHPSADEELGLSREAERPVVSIAGRAREGTRSMAVLYERLLADARAALPGAALKAAPSPRGTQFEMDVTLFAPRSQEPETPAAEE